MVHNKAEYISIVLFGLFCMWQAFQIETSESSMVGPRLVPVFISVMIVVLGVLQIIVAWAAGRTRNVKSANSSLSHEDAEDSAALRTTAVLRIIIIPVVGFVYIWLFAATGYVIATALIIAFVLFLFGTRKPARIAIIAVGAAVAYYFIFVYLIGIYAPPGWLFSLGVLGL